MIKKRIASIILALIMVLTLVPETTLNVRAASALPLGEWYTSEITNANSSETLTITLPSAGKLTLDFQTYTQWIYYDIIDTDGVTAIEKYSKSGGTATTPAIHREVLYLDAGTYTFKARQYSSFSGKYEVKATFTSANATEVEPNNMPQAANPFTFDAWNIGILSETETLDYYAITIPSSGKLNLEFHANMQWIYYEVVDTDGITTVKKDSKSGGTEATPSIEQWTLYLEPGTYYLKVSKYSSFTGKYDIKGTFTSANVTEAEPNNSPQMANAFPFDVWNVGILSETENLDYYTLTIPESGKVILDFRAYMTWINFEVLSSDGITTVKKDSKSGGSEATPALEKWTLSLNAGTYYIKVTKYSSFTGKYEMKATLAPPSYTITATSGTGGKASGGGTFDKDTATTLFATANSGYDFDGWYIGSTKVSAAANYTFTVTGDQSLQARFTPKTYIVSFKNGNIILKTQSDVKHGASASAPLIPTKKGYVFAGWDRSYSYVTENIIVNAKWAKIKAGIVAYSKNVKKKGWLTWSAYSSNSSIKSVSWKTSKKSIASVKASGRGKVYCKITGKRKGKATITANITFYDGSKKTVKQTIRVK